MMHKAWSRLDELPCRLSRSSAKFRGLTGQNIEDFDLHSTFPDCKSSLNWPMAMKWFTKLDVAQERWPIVITRDSEVIMFSPCVFVSVCLSVCLCLSRCLSGRFNYEWLVPHKQYFACTLLGMSSCASYVSLIHDVIGDVTRSQSRSNFEIDTTPSIFELERWSKAQMSEMLMAIFLVYSTSGITSDQKRLSRAQNGSHFENF